MHKIDGYGATGSNEFTEGDPASTPPVPATRVTDDWLNSVQRELVALIQGAGLTLDKLVDNQILLALRKGHGSTFDADKIDGVEGARVIFGDNSRGSIGIATADLNTILKSGFYQFDPGAPNSPSAGANGPLLHMQFSGADTAAMQIAFNQATAGAWIRGKTGGAWGSWFKLWNENNDGSGSGLDADLVRNMAPASAASVTSIMSRDANGRSQVANPAVDADIANRGWVRDFVYPVGSYYVQFPDQASNTDSTEFPTAQRPATLFGGTWAEQWATESVYFRTRGALSDNGRVDGKQEDAGQGHLHRLRHPANVSYEGTDGVFTVSASGSLFGMARSNIGGSPQQELVIRDIITDGSNGTPRTAAETRTVNRRIKIWKRTA